MNKKIHPRFKSKLENDFYTKHDKLIIGYETDRIGYNLPHHYTPDFKIGEKTWVETKGQWHSGDRTKISQVLTQNPGVTIIMAFQNPHQPLYTGARSTYSDWCNRRGIPWVDANDTQAVRNIIAEYTKS
jgi:hypothetical protein